VASARSVIAALDPERFEAVPVGITREGRWLLPADAAAALREGPRAVAGPAVAVVPGAEPALVPARDGRAGPAAGRLPRVDVVFPVLHGPYGEDGTVQGLLELAGVPYVGSGVLGSAVGMDKIVQKDLFVRHGLPVVDYLPVDRRALREDADGVVRQVVERLGLPCFIKPANLGSSVGITQARTPEEVRAGLAEAARHDRRVLCERAVTPRRELECGILGNDDPRASVVGEVVPRGEFYDYESKYTPGGAELRVPADLPAEVAERIREMALAAFRILDCAGMARVDFFLEPTTGRLYVNELNTIPGFTATSMYPRLWEASGVPYRELLTRLVMLALERHAERG
jgi:D-alanine-D-alanine ligase